MSARMVQQVHGAAAMQPDPRRDAPSPLVPVRTGARERWVALDRFRALAVLWMIQGHVFTALLRPDAMPSSLARWHDRLHGLTAPAFMFGAGLAFGTATYGEYRAHQRLGQPLARRMRWYLLLFVIGYLQQAPGWSFWGALHAQGHQLQVVSRVGALQLIALALAVCQLAILIVPRPRAHVALMLGLGTLLVLAATPVARWGEGWQGGSVFLHAYLENRGGAHFQPLPWAAFVLLGVASAGLLSRRTNLARAALLCCIGGLVAVLAFNSFQHTAATAGPGWPWRTSVSYFLFRLGSVGLLLGVLHIGTRTARTASRTSLFARHSLVAYLVHLALLYGTPWSRGMARHWPRTLGLRDAALATCALLAITVLSVYVWAWLLRLRRAWLTPSLRTVPPALRNSTRVALRDASTERGEARAAQDAREG